MCSIFSGQSPRRYAGETRSIQLGGHSTSIRLETAFWEILEEAAAAEAMSLPKFLTTLHDDVVAEAKLPGNFTSLLRCACLTYLTEARGVGGAAIRDERAPDLDRNASLKAH